jgi:hypothetical protein
MKYLLLGTLLVGLILPGSATSAQDIVGKEGGWGPFCPPQPEVDQCCYREVDRCR